MLLIRRVHSEIVKRARCEYHQVLSLREDQVLCDDTVYNVKINIYLVTVSYVKKSSVERVSECEIVILRLQTCLQITVQCTCFTR